MADESNFQNRMSNQNRGSNGQGNDPLAELARLIGQNDPFAEINRPQQAQKHPQQTVQAPPQQPPRTMTAEPQLSGPPFPEPAAQPISAANGGNYRIVQDAPTFAAHAQAAHAQAPREVSNYRDTAYRDYNQMPQGNEFYDDTEPEGRGRTMKTAMAVGALALIGIVSAFGYRMVFSGPTVSGPPPVIKANSEPTKVPPPVANNESSQNKLTDRVGDRGQPERVVSREETPVDARDLNRPNSGRNQPPLSNSGQWSQVTATNQPPTSSTANVPTTGQSAMAMGEPKKVRTVPIRPDPNSMDLSPPSLSPPNATTPITAPPAPRANNTPPSPPITPSTSSAPNFASNQRPPVNTAPPIQPTQQAPANGPLSLGDEINPAMPRTTNQPPPARQAPPQQVQRQAPPIQQVQSPVQRQAAIAPSTQNIAPAPSGGGFMVQVSSQKTEAEAQTALRSMQAKYPTVVGGQQVSVQRADLGSRGIYYRAMLGPFANRDQANLVCGNLKAAGGSCIVQGN